MEFKEMIELLEALTEGADPSEPRAREALQEAIGIVKERARRPRNSGSKWRVEDEARLAAGHASGKEVPELAHLLGRTPMSVRARLVRLGLLDREEAGNLRYAV